VSGLHQQLDYRSLPRHIGSSPVALSRTPLAWRTWHQGMISKMRCHDQRSCRTLASWSCRLSRRHVLARPKRLETQSKIRRRAPIVNIYFGLVSRKSLGAGNSVGFGLKRTFHSPLMLNFILVAKYFDNTYMMIDGLVIGEDLTNEESSQHFWGLTTINPTNRGRWVSFRFVKMFLRRVHIERTER
jgi:hypothetical protein